MTISSLLVDSAIETGMRSFRSAFREFARHVSPSVVEGLILKPADLKPFDAWEPKARWVRGSAWLLSKVCRQSGGFDPQKPRLDLNLSKEFIHNLREFAMPKAVSYAQWSLEPYCIGLKLRSLRTRKRLTLSRLAAETGLSTALLSKLETDRMIPTLPTLATICRVYGVGLSHFFAEPARHMLSITRKAHLQASARGPESVKVTPLNHGDGAQLRAQMIELPPGGVSVAMDGAQDTNGLVYVLEGKLRLDVGGTHEVLEAGDCACVESDMPLAWSAADKRRCRVLAILPGKQNAAN